MIISESLRNILYSRKMKKGKARRGFIVAHTVRDKFGISFVVDGRIQRDEILVYFAGLISAVSSVQQCTVKKSFSIKEVLCIYGLLKEGDNDSEAVKTESVRVDALLWPVQNRLAQQTRKILEESEHVGRLGRRKFISKRIVWKA